MGIFSQIKERRLFGIVASYLAAGWIALEVVDQFVDREVVPEFLYEVVLLGYLCGIPAALIVGWYHGEKGAQRAPRTEIVALSVLTLLFLTGSSFAFNDYREEQMRLQAAHDEAGVDLRDIGVLYFTDYTGGREYQHVADGLTEALIDELSAVPALGVVSRNGVAPYRNSGLPRDSVGRLLGVGTLVDGSVEETNGNLRVTLRVFDAASGQEFRSTTIERPAQELLAARDQVVEDVARLLRSWLRDEVRLRSRGQRITNVDSWTLYQRAEKLRKDAEAAIEAHDTHTAAAAFARADSLLASAELLAPDWADPIVLRGHLAYRRSRLTRDADRVLALIEEGLGHAARALELTPRNARALELRGTLRYWKYLQPRGTAPDERGRLLASARADLEEAVRVEPTLASAHSTLSHLLVRAEDISSAVLAARRAYEADAYLEAAPSILWRLTSGSYDLENFDQLERWCREGYKRFPTDWRFSLCQLIVMTTRQGEPDVDRAWRLVAAVDSLAVERERASASVWSRLLVGGVIARAARAQDPRPHPDSARRVLARATDALPHAGPRQQLLTLAAYMYTLADDDQKAIELLRRYAAIDPGYSFEHHWWWRDLRGKAEFQPLLTDH